MSKRCNRCGKTKGGEHFNRRAKARDGLRTTCKKCDREIRILWESKHRDGPQPPSEQPPEASAQAPEAPEASPEKVIGRIGPTPEGPRIKEVALDPLEEAEQRAAREYAEILNKGLPVRKRARLMISIAKKVDGANAALALRALQDINLATGVVSKTGSQVDLGPLFVLPAGSDVSMKSGA